ncbi:nucleoside-diphosphate kinase [Pasteuria penetrans]|uniref:nucleoside-diphosphate kinase n=1 Tax=Pasteuria penetrans TaxID=86005 RepID=UPI000F9AF9AE|nr:nucleoside-diphosphate kinase [Pasteuria penetrans]
MKERTFVMVKPDGVKRQLVGEIIRRLEQRGFILLDIRMFVPTESLARQHYRVHCEKHFFPNLIRFITSGPVVAMAWEGSEIVAAVRRMLGPTNPVEAPPGTLRGDFATHMDHNIAHASDSVGTAQEELALWFSCSSPSG